MSALRRGLHAAYRRPAFTLYLAALAALGFKWLSPLSTFYERTAWTDVLVAASAVVWVIGQLRSGRRPRIRAFHVAMGLFIGAGVLSMAFAGDHATAAKNVLLLVELSVLALLTSEFASDRGRLNAIVMVISIVALYSAALVIVGLALFYVGVDTSLLGGYGELPVSDRYARMAAGFGDSPLLATFCIFASAVVARDDVTLPRGLRLTTQVALGVTVVATLTRGIIGFAVALAIRAAYRHRTSRRARVAAIAFVAASVVLLAGINWGRLSFDPTRPTSVSYEFPEQHNRPETFAASLQTLAEHPIVGAGPGSLPGKNHDRPFRAHLTPLNIAATMGLPALAAITYLMLVLWRRRRRPTPIATWSGLAGLGIDALSQDIEHFRYVWVMIGLADADRQRE